MKKLEELKQAITELTSRPVFLFPFLTEAEITKVNAELTAVPSNFQALLQPLQAHCLACMPGIESQHRPSAQTVSQGLPADTMFLAFVGESEAACQLYIGWPDGAGQQWAVYTFGRTDSRRGIASHLQRVWQIVQSGECKRPNWVRGRDFLAAERSITAWQTQLVMKVFSSDTVGIGSRCAIVDFPSFLQGLLLGLPTPEAADPQLDLAAVRALNEQLLDQAARMRREFAALLKRNRKLAAQAKSPGAMLEESKRVLTDRKRRSQALSASTVATASSSDGLLDRLFEGLNQCLTDYHALVGALEAFRREQLLERTQQAARRRAHDCARQLVKTGQRRGRRPSRELQPGGEAFDAAVTHSVQTGRPETVDFSQGMDDLLAVMVEAQQSQGFEQGSVQLFLMQLLALMRREEGGAGKAEGSAAEPCAALFELVQSELPHLLQVLSNYYRKQLATWRASLLANELVELRRKVLQQVCKQFVATYPWVANQASFQLLQRELAKWCFDAEAIAPGIPDKHAKLLEALQSAQQAFQFQLGALQTILADPSPPFSGEEGVQPLLQAMDDALSDLKEGAGQFASIEASVRSLPLHFGEVETSCVAQLQQAMVADQPLTSWLRLLLTAEHFYVERCPWSRTLDTNLPLRALPTLVEAESPSSQRTDSSELEMFYETLMGSVVPCVRDFVTSGESLLGSLHLLSRIGNGRLCLAWSSPEASVTPSPKRRQLPLPPAPASPIDNEEGRIRTPPLRG